MKDAVNARKPVIALIHGATIGRGEDYGDHWVVVRGFSDDGQTVYLNDPDDQSAKRANWIVGGPITLPYATFRQAAYSAAPGPYGIIVGDGLSNAPSTPSTPDLQSPANGAQFDEGQPITLSWSATGNEYYGEIWGGPGGTLTFGWQSGTSINIGSQWAGYTYSWHVKARNSAGESAYSSTSTFRVNAVATCPTITEWKGEYWNNRDLSGPIALCRNDVAVNFDWGSGGPGGNVGGDNFSARWTRDATFTAGRYRFHLAGDDGVRLLIDGNLLIDRWVDQERTEYSVDIDLGAGGHSLKVEYFENGGVALVALWWEALSTCPAITDWKGEYFNNESLYGAPALCRNDVEVNFEWVEGSPDPSINADHFSARWTRNLLFEQGTYQFRAFRDDGIRLWVDDTLVIDQWSVGRDWQASSPVTLSAGSHALRVEMFEHDGWAAAQLVWEQLIPGDAYEPDDGPDAARSISSNGSAQTHHFHIAGDNDWVNFAATAGASYTIQTLNLGASGDTYLYLYDTDGATELATNDDSEGTLASRIDWVAPEGGTYFVRVRHFSPSAAGAATSYDLKVTTTSTPVDAYEPDDSAAAARPITVDGSAQTHTFHSAGDNDWVTFTATANTFYTLQTLNLGTSGDTYLYLYDTDATTELSANDDSGGTLASRIDWVAPASGTYFLRVRHFLPAASGTETSYDLKVLTANTVAVDSYEPDNNAEAARSIGVNGGAQTHNFHAAGDNDWLKFSATAGASYVIRTFDLGTGGDTYLYLYDTGATTELSVNDDSNGSYASRIEWTAPASGTYFVRVRHYYASAYGPETSYSLEVTTMSAAQGDSYEPDDSAGAARVIAVDGGVQTHNFHLTGDNDWLKFSANAGSAYTIQTLNLGAGSDTYLYLYATDGATELAHNDDYGAGFASRIVWTAARSGTYYVRLRHYASRAGSTTTYDVRVTLGAAQLAELAAADPAIETCTPNAVDNQHDNTITVRGSGFVEGSTVYLDETALSSKYIDPNTLSAVVPKNFKPGTYKLIVRNDDGGFGTLPEGLTIGERIPANQPVVIHLPLVIR